MEWGKCWGKMHTKTDAGYGLFARQNINRGQPILPVYLDHDAWNSRTVEAFMTINHSCIPNMFQIEDNDPCTEIKRIRLYAYRDIKAGEELTRCYLVPQSLNKPAPERTRRALSQTRDLAKKKMRLEDDVVERRAWIWNTWGFYCICLKCVGQWDIIVRFGPAISVKWKCLDRWVIDYSMSDQELSTLLSGFIAEWETKNMRITPKEKIQIMAQRTVFTLRKFGQRVKIREVLKLKRNDKHKQNMEVTKHSRYAKIMCLTFD